MIQGLKNTDSVLAVCIDTLEIVYEGYPLGLDMNTSGELNSGFTVETVERNSSPFYYSASHIYYNKKSFCTIYYGSNQKLRYKIKEHCLIILENPVLYLSDTCELLIKLESILGLKIYNYSTVHIAVDGIGFMEKQMTIKRNADYKRQRSVRYSEEEDERNDQVIEIKLGSRMSDKYLVFYRKYQSAIKYGKNYLIDYWKLNGFGDEVLNMVERMELRLRRKEVMGLTKNLTELFSATYLMGVFKNRTEKQLTYKHKTNSGTYSLIKLDTVTAVTLSLIHI